MFETKDQLTTTTVDHPVNEIPLFPEANVFTTNSLLELIPPGKSFTDLSPIEIQEIFQKLHLVALADGSRLVRLVAELGSTHELAEWREAFHRIMAAKDLEGTLYDPKFSGDDWKDWYGEIESLFKRISAVLLIRLENNGLTNGSLGSIAEISMMLLTSVLFGQKLVISIESDIADSLKEPGALTQYLMLRYILKHRPANLIAPSGMALDYSASHSGGAGQLEQLSNLTVRALDLQIANPLPPQADILLSKIPADAADYKLPINRQLVLAGSGAVDKNSRTAIINRHIEDSRKSTTRVETLSTVGELNAAAWNKFYQQAELFTTKQPGAKGLEELQAEFDELMHAQFTMYERSDVVFINIAGDQLSKGALTEVPLIAAHCLKTGKPFCLLIEPIDPIVCMQNLISDHDEVYIRELSNPNANLNSIKGYFSNQGIAAADLDVASEEELRQAVRLLFQSFTNAKISWKEIKSNKILGKLNIVLDIMNSIRARGLVQADWRRLKSDYPNLPYFENSSEWLRQVDLYFKPNREPVDEDIESVNTISRIPFLLKPYIHQIFELTKNVYYRGKEGKAELLRLTKIAMTEILAKLADAKVEITEAELKHRVASNIQKILAAGESDVIMANQTEKEIREEVVNEVLKDYYTSK